MSNYQTLICYLAIGLGWFIIGWFQNTGLAWVGVPIAISGYYLMRHWSKL